MTRVFLMLMLFSAAAFGYCDLKVVILRDPTHPKPVDPKAETRVVVRKASGEELEPTRIRFGFAEFCDVGLGRFSVIVGSNRCGQVTVDRLFTGHETLTIKVYYEPCEGFPVFSGCKVLVRVKDDQGRAIPAAKFQFPKAAFVTDEYGRFRNQLDAGSRAVAVVSAEGFESKEVELFCAEKYQPIETSIQLSRVR
jgi:hypothetical protein